MGNSLPPLHTLLDVSHALQLPDGMWKNHSGGHDATWFCVASTPEVYWPSVNIPSRIRDHVEPIDMQWRQSPTFQNDSKCSQSRVSHSLNFRHGKTSTTARPHVTLLVRNKHPPNRACISASFPKYQRLRPFPNFPAFTSNAIRSAPPLEKQAGLLTAQ